MDAKQIRANLKSQRDQKFRKYSDKQLAGFDKRAASRNLSFKNGELDEAMQSIKLKLKKYHAKNKQMTENRVKSMNSATSKPIVTPYGEYVSISEFERQTGVKLFRKYESMPHLYYYKEDGPGDVTYETVCYSPYGCAPITTGSWNRKALFDKIKASGDPDAQIKGAGEWWRKMMRKDPDNYYEKKEIKREWGLH